jgi:hypothetical protein
MRFPLIVAPLIALLLGSSCSSTRNQRSTETVPVQSTSSPEHGFTSTTALSRFQRGTIRGVYVVEESHNSGIYHACLGPLLSTDKGVSSSAACLIIPLIGFVWPGQSATEAGYVNATQGELEGVLDRELKVFKVNKFSLGGAGWQSYEDHPPVIVPPASACLFSPATTHLPVDRPLEKALRTLSDAPASILALANDSRYISLGATTPDFKWLCDHGYDLSASQFREYLAP